MANQETKKKKSKLGRVLSIIVDVLVIPVIIIAFACTILTFSAKANNKVPQIFGKSIVTVLTSSMEPDFMVGDVLIINKVDVDTLKVGDNIAFYAPIWLGSPYTTTLDNGEKVSNIIYHQIVTIINAPNQDGVKERYFVCRGTNLSEPEYVYVGDNNGYYIADGQGGYVMTEDGSKTGDYDVKLENMPADTEGDINAGDIEDSSMSTMQYVSDDLVVGVYDASLSPAIGGFIKFCSSSTGLIVLVIIPAALMLACVAFGLVKEVKSSKEETEQDQLELEGNIEKLKETSFKAKQETGEEEPLPKKKIKKEEVDMNAVISGAVADANDGNNMQKETQKQEKAVEVKAKETSVGSKTVSAPKTATTAKASTTQTKPVASKPTTSVATKTTTASKPVAKTPPATVVKPISKSTAAKPAASKPTTVAATKPTVAKPRVTKPVTTATNSAAEKPAITKSATSTTAKTATKAKPVITKPVAKPVVKPTAKKDG